MDVGDRVLLANKGERGRRKLADRWENHLYTVVEKQENTHTFRLRNCDTDQEKVVHRNLIMPVNFLPIPDDPEDWASSVSDLTEGEVNESALDVGIEGSSVLPAYGPEDRTVSWVSQLPAASGEQSSAEADVPVADDSAGIGGAPDQPILGDVTVDIDCPGGVTNPQSDLSTPPAPSGASLVAVPGADHGLVGGRTLDVTTRCGRVVRPVVRLIQNMHQKVFVGH